MQAQQNFAREHSFKPQINNKYKVAPQRELSKDERWKNLYQPKTEKILQRDMMKAQREIEDIKKHCTFKPQLGSVNDLTTEGGSNLGSARKQFPPMPHSARSQSFQKRIPIQDRLIAENEKKRENLEKIKRDQELRDMEQCTFQPRLNEYKLVPRNPKMGQGPNAMRSQTPIHERIGDLQREKNENL